jgi:transposase
MDVNGITLPTDVRLLHQMIQELLESVHQKDRRIGTLEHRLDQLLRRLYGRSREKMDPNQLALFQELIDQAVGQDGPGQDPASETAQAETSTPTCRPKGKGHGRRKLPENLPRRQEVHEVPEAERICPCCGEAMSRIGQEVSEQLDFVPASLYVVEHIRAKYACRSCEGSVVTADKPNQPIEKGLPGPGLLAQVIVSKYGDHLPLYRLEGIFERHGVRLHRSTLCGWMGQSAGLLTPLYDVMAEQVRASKVIGTDDTPVNVQDSSHPKGIRQGRFWVYVGDEVHPSIVYDYTPSRARDGPEAFLGDYEGYLQADAFGGYDGIYLHKPIIEVLCWAHARRKFYDAQGSDAARAMMALGYIRRLYAVESQGKDLDSAARRQLRQEETVPVLEAFQTWMKSQLDGEADGAPVLPKSPMGMAVQYCLRNWKALLRYTKDGDLSIDNNASERALRPIAVGRKNWLFAGSDNGGRTAAVLYSLVASAKRHGLDPFAYLRDVIGRISDHPARRLADLLPDRWSPASEER